MELTYKKVAKEFTVAGATGATGLPINGVLVVPDDLVTWSLDDGVAATELDSLDIYMSDFGYVRVF